MSFKGKFKRSQSVGDPTRFAKTWLILAQLSQVYYRQYILASWTDLARGRIAQENIIDHCLTQLSRIAECEVAHRPGRIEPRALKRRRHGDKLMTQPRHVLKKQLESGNAKT